MPQSEVRLEGSGAGTEPEFLLSSPFDSGKTRHQLLVLLKVVLASPPHS